MSHLGKGYRGAASRAWLSLFGLLLLLLPLTSCNTPAAPEPIKFTSWNLSIPAEAMKSPVVGKLPDATKLQVRVTFKIDPNVLKQAEQQKVQPGTPSKLEGFANKLGISDGLYQKIKGFFSGQGIALKLSKLRTHLSVDAKASTLAKLLQTSFDVHEYNGRKFYAPSKAPQIPTFLANSIDAITGLDNYSPPPVHTLTPLLQQQKQSAQQQRTPAQDCSPQDQTLLPREIAGAYGYDQLWNRGLHGENMTVNLVEIDGSYRNDITNYEQCVQFKGKVTTINVDGHPQEALGESTLDIQMVMGLARSSTINVYQTDISNQDSDVWTNVNDMLQQLLDDNVNKANSGSVVSISLGAAEGEMTQEDVRALDSSLKQLTQVEHMTVFVASGDCGAFTSRRYGDLSVAYPASDPNVVAVGGTILQVNGTSGRANEIAWSDKSNTRKCTNQWGTGGGVSQLFQRPSWQNALGASNQSAGRNARQVPDVAAAAYALAVYFKGQWGAVGGTSAAAPIWAAGLALVNQGLMHDQQTFHWGPQIFYQAATGSSGQQAYYDITRGDNLYYRATSGWDFTTGLGTPNAPAFYQAVAALPRQ